MVRLNRETFLGLYWGFVVNWLVVDLLHNPVEGSTRVWLVTLGATNELLGVLFVASPEIGRVLPGFLAKVRKRVDVVVRVIRRYFEKPRDVVLKVGGVAEASGTVGTPTIVQTPGLGASLDERVNYLMERDRENRTRFHVVERELVRLPEQWHSELEGLRTELEELQRELVRRVAEARIRLRLLGLAYVIVGIVLAWLGNVL
jgi:hypothetical protein